MLMDRYIEEIENLYKKIMNTQRDNIVKAADLIVDALKSGANIHVFDTGHIINSELINRAGGLALLKQFKYTFTVDDPVRISERNQEIGSLEGIGKLVVKSSKAVSGDVFIMGSVSGKTVNVIDIGLAAKERGLKIIAITSLEYSTAVESDHSSGKHLYELGDVVIDNCAPKGDAMLEVEGADNKFGPASGLSSAYIMWCVCAEVIEKMVAAKISPTLFRSVNFPGGWDNYREMCKRYEDMGL